MFKRMTSNFSSNSILFALTALTALTAVTALTAISTPVCAESRNSPSNAPSNHPNGHLRGDLTSHLSSIIENADAAFSSEVASTQASPWEFREFYLGIAPYASFGISGVPVVQMLFAINS